MGGLISERSGVINLGLEGLMLMGAFTGASVAYCSGSPWLGFAAAGVSGALLALVFGFFTLSLRGDQVVVGMGINLLSVGLTPFLNKYFFQVTSSTPSLGMQQHFIYAPTVVALAIITLVSLWLRRSYSGLWVRFAGEHPTALASAGISVLRTRWVSVIVSGVLGGFGGATMATMLASAYSRQMTAGAGFMAIAALILGRWSPVATAFACLLFGLTDSVQIRLQGLLTGSETAWVLQLIQLSPYVVTIVVLAGVMSHSKAPKNLGVLTP